MTIDSMIECVVPWGKLNEARYLVCWGGGVGLCNNVGPTSSPVFYTYFESTNSDV